MKIERKGDELKKMTRAGEIVTTTRKKLKIIGTEEYINKKTGEIEEMQTISIEERDANFHKLWLGNILSHIDLIGNQKAKLAFWILDNLDSENKLVTTQRKIAETTKMSIQTVNLTMKALINSNFLIKINSGAYRVNPDIIFKGGKSDRVNILIKYQNERKESNNVTTKKD